MRARAPPRGLVMLLSMVGVEGCKCVTPQAGAEGKSRRSLSSSSQVPAIEAGH